MLYYIIGICPYSEDPVFQSALTDDINEIILMAVRIYEEFGYYTIIREFGEGYFRKY